MSKEKSAENSFASSQTVTITRKSESACVRYRRRNVQNVRLIWLDSDIDELNEDYQNKLVELRNIIHDVNICTQQDELIELLKEFNNIKTFLIVEDSLSQETLSSVHDLPQLLRIYMLCSNTLTHEHWIKEFKKVEVVHRDMTSIYESLQKAMKQNNQDAIALSFLALDKVTFNQDLNQLDPSFKYTQIFKEILLDHKYDQQSIKDFTDYCRNNDSGSLTNITRFENEYHIGSAVWWYTFPSFIYSMLNNALRKLEADTMMKMGFFIHDLHYQIKQMYEIQVDAYRRQPFVVYRGQGLSKMDFEKLLQTKSGLISFNNFLSTSRREEISLNFSKGALMNADTVGVLFKILIDPSISSAPFAFIKEVSYFKEEDEILFSTHTIFRIEEITKIDHINLLYQVDLTLTADNDQELRTLTQYIKEEVGCNTNWEKLSVLLVKLGRFDRAEKLITKLLEQKADEKEKACYYNNLGYIKNNQGNYDQALHFYEKALEINENMHPIEHLYIAVSYNNIGSLYHNIEQYTKALSFYQKALEIREQAFDINHPIVATSYSNIGGVYTNMGNISKALSFDEKALKILQKTLPLDHPLVATAYNNTGSTYDSIVDYAKALTFYEKAHQIREKTLPPNHPVVITSYNNTARMYERVGEHLKALHFYKKALRMREKSLPSDHPNLASSYNNIASAYDHMGEYSNAILYYEKALAINQQALPSHDPNLATSYCNIGFVFKSIGDPSKALSYFERALDIEQHLLPPNHPDLAGSYASIGSVYSSMGEYSKALSFYEKALAINQQALPTDHPHLASSYYNIGFVFKAMGNSAKALSYFDRALDIKQRSFPTDDPDIKKFKRLL